MRVNDERTADERKGVGGMRRDPLVRLVHARVRRGRNVRVTVDPSRVLAYRGQVLCDNGGCALEAKYADKGERWCGRHAPRIVRDAQRGADVHRCDSLPSYMTAPGGGRRA